MTRLATLVAVFAVVPVAAGAAELPRRKSGLWEISTVAQQGKPVAAQMCVDRKTDDLTRQLAGAGVTCSKQSVKRESATRYVIDSVCRFGDSTATSRAVFTGSFDERYDVDINAKYVPPMMGIGEGRSRISARWLGPCKAGQRAGDIILPNGITMNVLDPPKPPPSTRPPSPR
ncbi:MAG: hypothetical protein IT508_12225 [Burkholderiaceae bacterium]|nr:hypothetical protein [Burkholderiaceae bacterium]